MTIKYCLKCGKQHTLNDNKVVFDLPDVIKDLSEYQRESRCQVYGDFIKLDNDRFFVKSFLPIPYSDTQGTFYWGVWAEVDLDTMTAVMETRKDLEQDGLPVLSGRLANDISYYKGTLGLKVSVRRQSQTRPLLTVTEPHELTSDQTNGVVRCRSEAFSQSV